MSQQLCDVLSLEPSMQCFPTTVIQQIIQFMTDADVQYSIGLVSNEQAYAATHGYIPILEKFRLFPAHIEGLAVDADRAHVIDWATKRGLVPRNRLKLIPPNAAISGSIQVIRWSQKQNIPQDDDLCMYAAMMGHLTALKWLRGEETEYAPHDLAPYPWDARIYTWGEGADVREWVRANGP